MKAGGVAQALVTIMLVLAVVIVYSLLVNSTARSQTIQITRIGTSTFTLVSSTLTVVDNQTQYVTVLENTKIVGTCQEGDYSVPYPYQTSISTSTIVSGNQTTYSKVTINVTVSKTTVEWTTGTPYLTRLYTNGTLGYTTTSMSRYENSLEWVVTTCSFP